MKQIYIALLRGVNVSGKNILPMKSLRAVLASNDFIGVKTYLQSGNVVFEHLCSDASTLETSLREILKQNFDLELEVFVFKKDEFSDLIRKNPFRQQKGDPKKRYYVFLKDIKHENLEIEAPERFPNESYVIFPEILFLYCKAGYGQSKLNNNRIEQLLKCRASTRNERTVEALIALVNS